MTFEHSEGGETATWTIEVEGDKLHVTADCPATRYCALGFNKDKPKMDGIDVFTFGHHPGFDLPDCRGGCGKTCGCGCGTTCGCGAGCGSCNASCGGCGCGARRLRKKALPGKAQHQSPFQPFERDLKIWLPAPPREPRAVQSLKALGGVVGVALNSVLLVHEHPGEGMTWVIDNCGGHGDTFGHYHYHAPPLCLLRSLGVPVPKGAWWKSGGPEQWAQQGPEVQIGWALDGAPIMAPFKDGVQVKRDNLDECHGAVDPVTGEYKYYTAKHSARLLWPRITCALCHKLYVLDMLHPRSFLLPSSHPAYVEKFWVKCPTTAQPTVACPASSPSSHLVCSLQTVETFQLGWLVDRLQGLRGGSADNEDRRGFGVTAGRVSGRTLAYWYRMSSACHFCRGQDRPSA